MTKEQIDALVKGLDRLGYGASDGDGIYKSQPTRTEVQPASVIPAPHCLIPR